jgi:hypothetical protein
MVVAALLAVSFLTRAGLTLLLGAWWRRWERLDLSDWLRPLGRRSVADEARRGLDKRV